MEGGGRKLKLKWQLKFNLDTSIERCIYKCNIDLISSYGLNKFYA